jgi:hypothetical protein
MGNQQMVVVVALVGDGRERQKSAPPRLLGINIESNESKKSAHRHEKLDDDEQ